MFQNWTSFFLTTAAVGAQLIGLLFVVVTIGSSLSKSQSVAGIRAFLTPDADVLQWSTASKLLICFQHGWKICASQQDIYYGLVSV